MESWFERCGSEESGRVCLLGRDVLPRRQLLARMMDTTHLISWLLVGSCWRTGLRHVASRRQPVREVHENLRRISNCHDWLMHGCTKFRAQDKLCNLYCSGWFF